MLHTLLPHSSDLSPFEVLCAMFSTGKEKDQLLDIFKNVRIVLKE